MTYLLALHPEALKRLREEILRSVGPTRRPTYDDIREMKYLRAVLNGTPVVFSVHAGLIHDGRDASAVPACVSGQCRTQRWR